MFKYTFVSQYQWLDQQIKQTKNDNSRDQQDKGWLRTISLCAVKKTPGVISNAGIEGLKLINYLTLSSRELLPQFSAYSGWRWLEVGEKVKKIVLYW